MAVSTSQRQASAVSKESFSVKMRKSWNLEIVNRNLEIDFGMPAQKIKIRANLFNALCLTYLLTQNLQSNVGWGRRLGFSCKD